MDVDSGRDGEPQRAEPSRNDDERRVDPRFLLANERTYLAWMRTALALVAGGLAVVQLVDPSAVLGGGPALGLPLVLFGALVAAAGLGRARAVERALREHRDLPRSRLPVLLTGAFVATAIAIGILSTLAR